MTHTETKIHPANFNWQYWSGVLYADMANKVADQLRDEPFAADVRVRETRAQGMCGYRVEYIPAYVITHHPDGRTTKEVNPEMECPEHQHDTDVCGAYRAAYVNATNLTDADDAHLGDDELRALGIERASEMGLIGPEEHQIDADDIQVGDWTETGLAG